MPTFQYTGRTHAGQRVRGARAAETAESLAVLLRREQVLVTKIVPVRAARPRAVRRQALAVFTRQFSVMVDAGLPLVQCLDLLAREEPDPRLSAAIDRARRDVEAGASLAEALAAQPHAFDAVYTQMVSAGEAGGILDSILQRLAVYIEKQVKLGAQVRSAMVYPAVVLSVAASTVCLILWKVVPTFTTLFQGLGAELPAPTRIVIWASRTMMTAAPVLVAATAAAAWAARRYYRAPAGRLRVDRLLLRIPLLGPVLRKLAVARFCRTLGTLTGSGVPILDGLAITAASAGNSVVEKAVRQVRVRIERGDSIAAPLKATGVFPPMVAQMIGAGESTGALDAMLGRIADFYEEEVDAAMAGLLTVLEPLLVTGLGVVVGAIVISMYLPLFSIINQLSSR